MIEFTKEQIEQKYNSLPADLRQAMDSPEIYEQFQTISKKHGLLIDKAGILEEEVSLVLLGLVPSSKFVSRLRENLEVSLEEAQGIANDVSETIFKGFRESLMKIHSENAEVKPLYKTGDPNQASPDGESEKIDREELLREIEKMDAGAGAPEMGDGRRETENQTQSIPENLGEIKTFPTPVVSQSKSIVEEKLSGPVKTSAEEIHLNRSDEKQRPDPGRKLDPYREPLE